MPKHKRRGDRETESSKVRIRGTDINGNSFEEHAEVQDISETGISFYLRTPIWIGSFLVLEITNSHFFGHLHTVEAVVVRLESDSSGRQFVGARFN